MTPYTAGLGGVQLGHMGMEGRPGFEVRQDVDKNEEKLAGVPGIRNQVESRSDLSDTEKAGFMERISAAEEELKGNLVTLYAELKKVDHPGYLDARYPVIRAAQEKTLALQEQEGRGYRAVEIACRDAWEKVKVLIGGAGVSAASVSAVMMLANTPTLDMDPQTYMETMHRGGEWLATGVESGWATLAALAVGWTFSKLHKKLATDARWKEVKNAQNTALEERGMEHDA